MRTLSLPAHPARKRMSAMYTIENIVQIFEMLPDWEQKYRFLTEVGEQLPPLSAAYQTPDHQVHGCMSKVWVIARQQADGALTFIADCDTPVVKGLIATLVVLFSGKTPQQVIDVDVDAVFHELGLDENISPNRHVGMYAMVDKIKAIARAIA